MVGAVSGRCDTGRGPIAEVGFFGSSSGVVDDVVVGPVGWD